MERTEKKAEERMHAICTYGVLVCVYVGFWFLVPPVGFSYFFLFLRLRLCKTDRIVPQSFQQRR